jgi:hypothetical protein
MLTLSVVIEELVSEEPWQRLQRLQPLLPTP